MKFEKFKVSNTDLKKISGLIYESNEEILKYAFGKNKEKAQKKIEKLIQIGKNHYGYENIYVAYDGQRITGFFIGYTGQEQEDRRKDTDSLTFLKLMHAYGIIKYKLFIRPLFMRISIVDMGKDDFYMDGISIDENYRNAGADSFLLGKSIEFAKNKDCKRLIADISLARLDEKEFYEKAGFKEYDKKIENIKSETIGNYFMEYILQ
jgi:ribosomal protein S18 acetylase RimI-like enzyme